ALHDALPFFHRLRRLWHSVDARPQAVLTAERAPCRMRPTSPPEQNARPAPVTMTTFTLSSAWASPSDFAQASIIPAVKALSLSGRFSVIVATLSLTS